MPISHIPTLSSHPTLRLLASVLLLSLLTATGSVARSVPLTEQGALTYSWQFDAAIDDQGILHLLGDHYYQFDLSGKLLRVETEVEDFQQYNLAFPPALDLDPEGNAHMVLRGPGSVDAGVDLSYRVFNADGTWQSGTRDYSLGPPQSRNSVLALAAISNQEVYAHHGSIDASGKHLQFWKLGDHAPEFLGNWTGVWRADLDTRMRTRHGRIYFASAQMVSSSSVANRVYFSQAVAGNSLVSDLEDNVQTHTAGSGRRGVPDLQVDRNGNAHLTYGTYQEVYYNRYRVNGSTVFPADKRILDNLGSWHLNIGISSLGISDDGTTILVAGLKTDNTKLAHNSELLLTWSTDGGANWSEPAATGIFTHGGEGRMRPRIMHYNDHFYLVYFDWAHNGLALASLNMNSLGSSNSNGQRAITLLAIKLLLLSTEDG